MFYSLALISTLALLANGQTPFCPLEKDGNRCRSVRLVSFICLRTFRFKIKSYSVITNSPGQAKMFVMTVECYNGEHCSLFLFASKI